jgi:Ca2+-binding EF-hand superfamily protein
VEWLFFYKDAMFKVLDKDGSGSLGPSELARALHMFHAHVAKDESQPLLDETPLMLVARKMLEHMYRHATATAPPSFVGMFDRVDTSGDGAASFLEMETMLRAHLKIGTRKVSYEQLKAFYHAIDVDGSGSIAKSEFVHFMMKLSAMVSKCFVTFPPPPQGMVTWDEAEPHDNVGRGFDWGEKRAAWRVPKSYDEMVRLNRTWRVIGQFSSLAHHGVTLPPPRDSTRLPTQPPLPAVYDALRSQIRKDVLLKERRENTAWDLSGPRYQVTRLPLEQYHTGRNAHEAHGGGLFSYPTRFGGSRLRHHEPLRTAHGVPLGVDEQRFADQKAAAHGAEPRFMATLPPSTGVYDRLCGVTTSSRLFGELAYADEIQRAKTAQGKRKGSAKGFVPL